MDVLAFCGLVCIQISLLLCARRPEIPIRPSNPRFAKRGPESKSFKSLGSMVWVREEHRGFGMGGKNKNKNKHTLTYVGGYICIRTYMFHRDGVKGLFCARHSFISADQSFQSGRIKLGYMYPRFPKWGNDGEPVGIIAGFGACDTRWNLPKGNLGKYLCTIYVLISIWNKAQ